MMETYRCIPAVKKKCGIDCDGTYNGTICKCAKDNMAYLPPTIRGELTAYRASGLSPERCAELAREDIPAAIDALVEYQSTLPIDKAREFSKAYEEGRLAVLPCKRNDIVYDIGDGTAYATRVISFSFFEDGTIACRTVSSYPDIELFGKRIFLTRAEAEATLKKCGEA